MPAGTKYNGGQRTVRLLPHLPKRDRVSKLDWINAENYATYRQELSQCEQSARIEHHTPRFARNLRPKSLRFAPIEASTPAKGDTGYPCLPTNACRSCEVKR